MGPAAVAAVAAAAAAATHQWALKTKPASARQWERRGGEGGRQEGREGDKAALCTATAVAVELASERGGFPIVCSVVVCVRGRKESERGGGAERALHLLHTNGDQVQERALADISVRLRRPT